MKAIHYAALVLVIVGAINWGLVGLFQFDLVAALFSESGSRPSAPLARVVYALVGLAGLAIAATSLAIYGNMRAPAYPGTRTGVPTR